MSADAFNPAYRVARCGQQSAHGPHVMEHGPDQPRNCPGTGDASPWRLCGCGHSMLLHDVEDMEGSNPLCCVDGCDQRGCGLSDADHYDVSCDDRPYCRIVEHHAGDTW